MTTNPSCNLSYLNAKLKSERYLIFPYQYFETTKRIEEERMNIVYLKYFLLSTFK